MAYKHVTHTATMKHRTTWLRPRGYFLRQFVNRTYNRGRDAKRVPAKEAERKTETEKDSLRSDSKPETRDNFNFIRSHLVFSDGFPCLSDYQLPISHRRSDLAAGPRRDTRFIRKRGTGTRVTSCPCVIYKRFDKIDRVFGNFYGMCRSTFSRHSWLHRFVQRREALFFRFDKEGHAHVKRFA